ncbi:hypothetical protein CDL12_23442 [Handroanthus impetiginosus]|uniref:Uncharacterized protein n=1 Tax=Handroanthus impetiginosus TaxID=429701 RepID=A0A2G9GFG4_9LAMI|nr:hypothetical protein CDL12_23442 [Handroanthus impetiginosus]
MESTNRMEKMSGDSNRGENEDDEKMEEFFALVRNFRNQRHQLQENNNKRKRTTTAVGGGGGWTPVFAREDFTSEIEFKKHVPTIRNNNNNCNNGSQDSKQSVESTSGLNLKLTL